MQSRALHRLTWSLRVPTCTHIHTYDVHIHIPIYKWTCPFNGHRALWCIFRRSMLYHNTLHWSAQVFLAMLAEQNSIYTYRFALCKLKKRKIYVNVQRSSWILQSTHGACVLARSCIYTYIYRYRAFCNSTPANKYGIYSLRVCYINKRLLKYYICYIW